MTSSESLDEILKIRQFNRFYTGYMGFLNRKMLTSQYSFTEARLLYELANRKMTKASALTADLGLDAGYLSRILTRLEKTGVITKQPCKIDGRSTRLIITTHGEKVASMMAEMSNSYISDKLNSLSEQQLAAVTSAMQTIEKTLEDKSLIKNNVLVREHQPGDIGWLIQVLGEYCAREFNFNANFEIKMAQSATNFISNYDPKLERSWIAELNGEKVGSIFLTNEGDATAMLRLFYLSPHARGLRLGQRLIDDCLKFARLKGYKEIGLWTTKNLSTARHLYQKAGFELMKEEMSSEFGPKHTNQYWVLTIK